MSDSEDFDVLSLFTPILKNEQEETIWTCSEIVEEFNSDPVDSEDSEILLQVLDLPMLVTKPPKEVLLVILRLLSPEQKYNFTVKTTTKQVSTAEQVFKEKNISKGIVEIALPWLKVYCPLINSEPRLVLLSQQSGSMVQSSDFMKYITTVVASPLEWIQDEEVSETIKKEASLRLAENCGRTAQPEFTRKIVIDNLEERVGHKFIALKEPSLTSDNLGLKTWGSSLILSNRLVNGGAQEGLLVNPVLELGSGTGLVGIVSSLLGYNTLLTDLPEITPNLRENVKLNEIEEKCSVTELDWSNCESFKKSKCNGKFKTIILSDPIYSSRHPFWIRDMLQEFLERHEDARVLLQIPIRQHFEKERESLWKLLDEAGLKETRVENEDGYDDFGEQKFLFKVFIWAN